LFNSNPGGAVGLSVCPLKYPVNLLSRSITAHLSVQLSVSSEEGNYFAISLLAFYRPQELQLGWRYTDSIPCIHRMPRPLSSILHMPNFR
jgi:hypothetical protein